jgi:hypothetical protein
LWIVEGDYSRPPQYNSFERIIFGTWDMVDEMNGNQVLLKHLMKFFFHAQDNQTKVVAKL